MDSDDESFASGGLAAVLRVGRFAGIAPLRFVKARYGWRISSSTRWSVYGYFMITAINLVTVMSLIVEFGLDQENTVRMKSNTQRAVWAVQSIVMAIASGAAVFSAPGLMHSMIVCLNQMQKINSELNIRIWPAYLGKNIIHAAIIHMIVCLTLSLIDYIQIVISGLQINEQTWLNTVYIFYFFSYWILQLRNILFIVIVLHVKYSFKVVNDNLKSMLQDHEELNKMPFSVDLINVLKKYKRVNNYFSTLNGIEKNNSAIIDSKFTEDHKKIRRLNLVFAVLCDVVRGVDHTHGPMVLIMLANFFLHLICTPYFFIIYLLDDVAAKHSAAMNMTKLVIQILWCLYHVSNVVSIVEPCHLTHMEMVKTRELINHLMRSTSSRYDPLMTELEQFFRYLLLNEVSYEPLKLIKMTRTLIFTLLGSITTYTVVILHI